MAGIALKDRVDLISIMVPLEVVANMINIVVLLDKHNLVRPNHECERGCAVLVEHTHIYIYIYIYMSFSSLCIFWKKLIDFHRF